MYILGYYLYGLMKLHEVASHELRGSDRRQWLEDLADLRSPTLDARQKLLVTSRMYRNFPQLLRHTKFQSEFY